MTATASTPLNSPRESIFKGAYLPTTFGLLIAILTCAFEQTAVTAVMPQITAELGGTSAYSLTFVIPLAFGIVGMVAAGLVTDTRGVRTSMLLGAFIFGLGLVMAVVIPSMGWFVVARAIQGLGIGAVMVVVYAVIAQAYPSHLKPKVFAAFAAAWVVPSLVGPGIAGILTEAFSWHSVFLLALGVLIGAVTLLTKSLANVDTNTKADQAALKERIELEQAGAVATIEIRPARVRSTGKSLTAAALLTAAVVCLNLVSQLPVGWSLILFVAAIAAVLYCVRPLVPANTLRGQAGLPRLILSRGLLDMFFAVEIYLPLMLAQAYHLGPTLTGMGLTAGGLTWFFGSSAQSRMGSRFSTPAVIRIGIALMATGGLIVLAAAGIELNWIVAAAGWGLSAAGMGFVYPRLAAKPMELCSKEETGFIGSALQVAGTTGMTLMISTAGMIQVIGAQYFPNYKFTALFATILLAAIPIALLWKPGTKEP